MSDPNTTPRAANDDRDGRMKLRKNNEEVLRKVVQLEARNKCLHATEAFGVCAKKEVCTESTALD